MQYGIDRSAETLAIEGELAQVQQRAAELQRERQELLNSIQILKEKDADISNEMIRQGPTGVSGAGKVASKKKVGISTWVETDLDLGKETDRGSEVEQQKSKERKAMQISSKSSDKRVYINTYEEEHHDYENFDKSNHNDIPYENENGESNEQLNVDYTLGDINDADDRVKKFYGIIPKDKVSEIKTVRMVKRDSKERNISKTNGADGGEYEDSNSPPPPPPLPRGNYQNMHDFFQNGNSDSDNKVQVKINPSEPSPEMNNGSTKAGRGQSLPRNYNFSYGNGEVNNGYPRPNFKIGDYYKKKANNKVRKSTTEFEM